MILPGLKYSVRKAFLFVARKHTKKSSEGIMTLGGWSMMFVMVGVISGLTFWCIAKVLADSASTGIHGPTDVDMPDLHDEDAPCRRAR